MLAERRGRYEPALEILGRGRAAFALVANADPYTYAGPVPIHVAPEARFELGIDLVAPRGVGAAELPRLLAHALLGRGQPNARRRRSTGTTSTGSRSSADRPMPLQADGEDLGDVTSAIFEAERGAALVLV